MVLGNGKRGRITLHLMEKQCRCHGFSHTPFGELQSYVEDGREYILDSNQQLNLDEDFERELIHGYYACVTFIDFQIGKIINKLNQVACDLNLPTEIIRTKAETPFPTLYSIGIIGLAGRGKNRINLSSVPIKS